MDALYLEIKIFETDILNLEKNYSVINEFTTIKGLIWLAGFTGDPEEEFSNNTKCEENLRINFLNPVLIINKIIPKINKNKVMLKGLNICHNNFDKKKIIYLISLI